MVRTMKKLNSGDLARYRFLILGVSVGITSSLYDLIGNGPFDPVKAGTVLVVAIAVGYFVDSLLARSQGEIGPR